MEATPWINYIGTVVFALAVLHTFVVKWISDWSERYPKDSFFRGVLHLLSEVEVVFGFWAFVLFFLMILFQGYSNSLQYLDQLKFNEALFVFCIMVIASVEPITQWVRQVIQSLSQIIHKKSHFPLIYCEYFVVLTLGPLSGSFITEPAAITITALLLYKMLQNPSSKMSHSLLAFLFVNTSIGGALTHFAAPPILMVAGKWGWGFAYVFSQFGLKSILAVSLNALLFILINKKEILLSSKLTKKNQKTESKVFNRAEIFLFFVLLFLTVIFGHHPHATMAIFLLFLGITTVMKGKIGNVNLRTGLLVAFFLGGLVFFGPLQTWWLTPLLTKMDHTQLYFGAIGLTSITDNAALTYLGSQVEGLSEINRFYLVAGAVVGGGLTLIANAPNPAGYSVLQSKFRHDFNPLALFAWALIPTLLTGVIFYFRSVLF